MAFAQETKRSGRFSDPATWGGKIPDASASITVNPKHSLTLDGDVSVCDITIFGTLTFDSKKRTTLNVYGNIANYGRLIRKPNALHDSIIFRSIDESSYKGGGMDIIPTDRGLWVREGGVVDVSGAAKTEWLNLAGPAYAGERVIYLPYTPKGWRIGDHLAIAPTGVVGRDHHTHFDTVRVAGITRGWVALDRPLKHDHPAVYNRFTGQYYTAEVMNLTRTFYLGGEGDGSARPENNGRAHINIMNEAPTFIRYTEIRHMGPRQLDGGYTKEVQGRYLLHFHHCLYGSFGSVIEGVVGRNSGGPAFVAHASHGITFKRNIQFDGWGHGYWWDVPPDKGMDTVNNSNFITYDSCVSALVRFDPEFRGYRLSNFHLGSGIGNTVINCVAVGNGGSSGAAGFLWPESSNYTPNLWVSENILSHNNKTNGIFSWQNDPHPHSIENYHAYRNGHAGIEHGAYINAYKYKNIYLIENGLLIHANAMERGVKGGYGYSASFINVKSTDPLTLTRHLVYDNAPTLIKDCIFPKIIINQLAQNNPRRVSGWFDFVDCGLRPEDFDIIRIEAGSLFRVQDKKAFQITPEGVKGVDLFFR